MKKNYGGVKMKKNVRIMLTGNLEARPIAMLVQTASKFDSSVYLSIGGKRVNAKSIMGMMSLTLKTDDVVEVEAEGPDEEEAVKEIEAYLSGEQ